MSSERFDELTKELANGGTSRRKFLVGVAGAAAAVLLRPTRAGGQLPGPGGSTCSNAGQSCAAQQCCQGLNCLTDFTNATEKFCCSPGSPLVCGSKCCPTGAVLGCSSGKCTCPTGEVVCPDTSNPLAGRCVNLAEDVNNCGDCGVSCAEPTGADAPCRVRACVNGGCTTIANPGANGAPCEDGNLCTLGDTCNNGTCQSGEPKPCAQCLKCDPSTGLCVADTTQNGTSCSTSKCLVGETCSNGVCLGGTPKNCDDNNECTADSCDEATGNCVHQPLTGTPCETGNKCTADTCVDGTCTQGPQTVTCPQCQVCSPSTGTCSNVANGTPCSDGDVCTLGDTCQGGTCMPGPVKTCGQCLTCADVGGVATCVADTSKNGQTCDDGNMCTLNDTCLDGVCVPGPLKDCSDNDVCTTDTCIPSTGQCVHTAIPGCCHSASECPQPSNQCQQATCVSNVCGVAPKNNGTSCSTSLCRTGETCQGGVCQGGTPKSCGDCKTCNPTTGNCDPLTGTPCGMLGSGRTCCAGSCCMTTDVCCSTGPKAGLCKRAPGQGCSNSNQCCGSCTSGVCT